MPSIKVDGMEDVFAMLKALGSGEAIESVQKQAVYAGMSVIREELIRAIEALPVQNGYLKSDDLPRDVITDREKGELLKHIGIAKMETKNGDVNTRISFDGYTNIKSKAYPNGLPAALLARSINSGSSVRQKHPFVRQAQAAAKPRAIEAAREAGQKALQEITEG